MTTPPETDNNYMELVLHSNLVADYSDEHYAIGTPSLILQPYITANIRKPMLW